MEKARKAGVNVPDIILNDAPNRKIYMEYVDNSLKARDFFNRCQNQDSIDYKLNQNIQIIKF